MDEEKLKEIFIKVFGEYDLEKKQNQYEKWDSFAHIELISEVESEFGLTLNADEVINIESAKNILDLIVKKHE